MNAKNAFASLSETANGGVALTLFHAVSGLLGLAIVVIGWFAVTMLDDIRGSIKTQSVMIEKVVDAIHGVQIDQSGMIERLRLQRATDRDQDEDRKRIEGRVDTNESRIHGLETR